MFEDNSNVIAPMNGMGKIEFADASFWRQYALFCVPFDYGFANDNVFERYENEGNSTVL